MVLSNPVTNQSTAGSLLCSTLVQLFAALAIGLVLWGAVFLGLKAASIPVSDRLMLLVLVVAQQIGFLLVSFRFKRSTKEGMTFMRAIVASVCVMAVAALLGVAYDVVVRWLGGSATIGPWGEVRWLPSLPAGVLVALAILLGPAVDERFFRAGLFGAWQAADRPWSGALLSSSAFALSRLDVVNLPAYFALGLLLCGVYRWTESLLAVWIGHALLNAAMLILLFSGYE